MLFRSIMALSNTWFVEHLIDFEYKKYQLLAYLKDIRDNFSRSEIYPGLGELVEHYKNLISFRSQTKDIETRNNNHLVSIDWAHLQLNYTSTDQQQSEILMEINQITDYAIPMFKQSIEEGRLIYEFVESQLHVEPVGLTPIQKEEGYLFLHVAPLNYLDVYQYHFSLYKSANDRYRTLATTYIGRRSLSFLYTPDKIKSELINEKRDLPNPAVYCITSTALFPLNETFLPVAKRYFVSSIC